MKTNPRLSEEEPISRLQVLKRKLNSITNRSIVRWSIISWSIVCRSIVCRNFLNDLSSVLCECQGDVEVVLR